MTKLAEAERAMTGFFAYDWLSVEPLVQLFASARDEDFKGVVKTGNYGQSYATILREVNALLIGKQVRPLEDLSGVEFVVMGSGGRETKLSPEDLSQGELKRLMIYAWLRANKAVDALVLIDEIEASFHPDWQVGIVRDLQEWAPKNQYLLATHSYELCQALTPRHVRELQPRLPWREPDADDAE
jgi:predicted ATPase